MLPAPLVPLRPLDARRATAGPGHEAQHALVRAGVEEVVLEAARGQALVESFDIEPFSDFSAK